MYWYRNTDELAGVVRYTALGGYEYRKGLRKLGFQFDGRERVWAIAVPVGDSATIAKVEEFLKASVKYDQTAARWRV